MSPIDSAGTESVDPFEAIKEVYFFLDNNYDALAAACPSEKDKKQLGDALTKAQEGYQKACAAVFNTNDASVNRFTRNLTKTQQQIAAYSEDLSKAAQTLALITKAVTVIGKLLAAAGVV